MAEVKVGTPGFYHSLEGDVFGRISAVTHHGVRVAIVPDPSQCTEGTGLAPGVNYRDSDINDQVGGFTPKKCDCK